MPATPPSNPRALLQEAAERRRYSLRQLSQRLGKNPTYLQQYVAKGSPKELNADLRVKLGRLLAIDPDLLRTGGPLDDGEDGTGRGPTTSQGAPWDDGQIERILEERFGLLRQDRESSGRARSAGGPAPLAEIPILCKSDGARFVRIGPDEAPEVIPRPDLLRGTPRAYAIRVLDGRFEPLLFAGDLCFVNPGEPTIPGDLVALTRHDGDVVIGRFCDRTGPKARLRSAANLCDHVVDDVRDAHKIVSVKMR